MHAKLGETCASAELRLYRVARCSGCVGTMKQSGVADRADARAMSFCCDALAKGGAGVAIGVADEAQLHELVGAQRPGELGEKCGREPFLADLKRGVELLAEGAKLGFLGAGEWCVRHGRRNGLQGTARMGNPIVTEQLPVVVRQAQDPKLFEQSGRRPLTEGTPKKRGSRLHNFPYDRGARRVGRHRG